MARRRKTPNYQSKEPLIVKTSGLAPPFPAPPSRLPTVCLYASYPASAPATERRILVWPFSAAYAARHFIDTLLAGEPYEWQELDSHREPGERDTIVGNDVVIRASNDLAKLLDHTFTKAEAEYELPEDLLSQCANLRRRPDPDAMPGEPRVKKMREPKPEKVRIDKTGLITAVQLAGEMKLEPRDLRAALRKAKLEKPVGGWCFSPDTIEEIKKTVLANLKTH